MRFSVGQAVLTLALGAAISAPAAAQDKPTIAIMPTQYFSATQESAQNVTSGLRAQWERQGYTVVDQERSNSTFSTMNLSPNAHYADFTAQRFGRSVGADLVAYPRLLAVGLPLSTASTGSLFAPEAILHLRVINVHTGQAIYFRQIGHEFTSDVASITDFALPQPVAVAAAEEASNIYFQRVAGSRQEYRGSR